VKVIPTEMYDVDEYGDTTCRGRYPNMSTNLKNQLAHFRSLTPVKKQHNLRISIPEDEEEIPEKAHNRNYSSYY
jgi:hypothetical protein